MSADPAYQVVPAGCGAAAAQWRAAAVQTADTVRAVAVRCRQLMLDDLLEATPSHGSEVTHELRAAADLLDATVDAVLSVGFDVTSRHLSGVLSTLSQSLRRSLDDGVGESPIDLVDPAPIDMVQTAHFGAVPLFGPGGPEVGDVHQGSLGDCGVIAAMASIALADPERIARMITDNGDGTYTVAFDGVQITVDDEFPVGDSGVPVYARGAGWSQPTALWPLVLEKAVAVHSGGGYAGVERRNGERIFDLFGEAGGMTIDRAVRPDASDAEVLDHLDEMLDAGLPVTASSDEDLGMGAAHAWSVVATGISATGEAMVTVRNPWGRTGFGVEGNRVLRDDGEELEGVDADEVHIDDDAAEMTLPLSAFADEFRDISHLETWDEVADDERDAA